jgi:hypothetical protein
MSSIASILSVLMNISLEVYLIASITEVGVILDEVTMLSAILQRSWQTSLVTTCSAANCSNINCKTRSGKTACKREFISNSQSKGILALTHPWYMVEWPGVDSRLLCFVFHTGARAEQSIKSL